MLDALRPLLAPFWDNLNMSTGGVYYQTTGTAPSRVFTLEWNNARWPSTVTSGTISFQVKLYEGTGRIEYLYRPEAGTPAYPDPIVDLAETRKQALEAYEAVKAADGPR